MTYIILHQQPETIMHFAEVAVTPTRVTDRNGNDVEVTGFWLNGPQWPTTTGYKIRKNGERYAVKSSHLDVSVPTEIREVLADLLMAEVQA